MPIARITPERTPRFSNTIEAGARRLRFDWYWNNRTRGWYVSIYDSEGNALVEGERLSVNSRVGFGNVDVNFLLLPGGDDAFITWENWREWAPERFSLYIVD